MDLMMLMLPGGDFLVVFQDFFFGLLVVQTELVEGGLSVIYMRFEEHIRSNGLTPTTR